MGPQRRQHTYNCDILKHDSGNVMHPIYPYNFTTNENICQTRRKDKKSSSIPNDGMCYIANKDSDDNSQPVLRIYDDDHPSEYASWSNVANLGLIPPYGTTIAGINAVFGDADESAFVTYIAARNEYTDPDESTYDIDTQVLNTYGDDLCLFAPTKDKSECHHYYNATTGELCGATGWNFPFTCTSRARDYHLVNDPAPVLSDIRDPGHLQTHCEHIEPCGTRVRNDPNNDYVADNIDTETQYLTFPTQRPVITCKDLGSTTADISTDSRNPTEIGRKMCQDFYVIDDEGHRRTCKVRSRSEEGRFSCDNPPAITDDDESDTPEDSDGVLWCNEDPNSCDSWLRKTFGPDSSNPPPNRRECNRGMLPFIDYTRSMMGEDMLGVYDPDTWTTLGDLYYDGAGQNCSDIISTTKFQQALADYCEIEYGPQG